MSVQYDLAGVGSAGDGELPIRRFPLARSDAGLADVRRAYNQTHRQRKFSSVAPGRVRGGFDAQTGSSANLDGQTELGRRVAPRRTF